MPYWFFDRFTCDFTPPAFNRLLVRLLSFQPHISQVLQRFRYHLFADARFIQNFNQVGCQHKVLLRKVGVSNTWAASTSGTTNSVHVVFYLKRHIIVDYELDIFNVQSSTSYVSCDKDITSLTIFETLKDTISFYLAFVSMNSSNASKSIRHQTLYQIINAFLGLTKNDDSRKISARVVKHFLPSWIIVSVMNKSYN